MREIKSNDYDTKHPWLRTYILKTLRVKEVERRSPLDLICDRKHQRGYIHLNRDLWEDRTTFNRCFWQISYTVLFVHTWLPKLNIILQSSEIICIYSICLWCVSCYGYVSGYSYPITYRQCVNSAIPRKNVTSKSFFFPQVTPFAIMFSMYIFSVAAIFGYVMYTF